MFHNNSIKETSETNKDTEADFRGTSSVIQVFCKVPALYVRLFTEMEG
jgi:hypothetical protein